MNNITRGANNNSTCHFRNMETLLHLLKGSLGTGILAMPNAFFNAGYVIGTVGTLLIGLVCTYCIHQLVSVHPAEERQT